jgi:hypothetical protein
VCGAIECLGRYEEWLLRVGMVSGFSIPRRGNDLLHEMIRIQDLLHGTPNRLQLTFIHVNKVMNYLVDVESVIRLWDKTIIMIVSDALKVVARINSGNIWVLCSGT